MEPLSLVDRSIVEWQLGRPPRGLVGIARRCVHGYPQVVTVYPLIDGKPFPTLYWLTCPFISREIDRMEAAGMIGQMEDRLHADQQLAERLISAHHEYIAERRQLLSDEDCLLLKEHEMLPSLMERGIGGIADFTRIKCLHLHVAHALVASNPVGEIVLDSLPNLACPAKNVICDAAEHINSV
jgi:hypothetical protein